MTALRQRPPQGGGARERLPRVVDLLAARAAEQDREAAFPYQGVEVVHEAGLSRLTVAERHRGPGAGLAEVVRVLVELGRGDPSVALLTAGTLLLHARQAHGDCWPEEYYRKLLAPDPAPLGTLAVDGGERPQARQDTSGGWVLNGRVSCVLGADALAWLAVRASAGESTGVFLIPGDAPGLHVEPTWDHLGLRAAAAHDVLLEEVEVPAEAAAFPDPEQQRWAAAWQQLAVPAVFLGTARAASAWAARRRPAPAAYERGETEIQLAAAEDLLLGLARRLDESDPQAVRRAAGAGLLATRTAVTSVSRLLTTTGPDALSRTHPLERHHRDTLTAHLYLPPEAEVLAAAVGE
jgi:alkylation response protein AidB-like acyl-CoA dehydrogenase